MTGTTVLLVDDHAPFRAAARAELEDSGFDVVGELGTAAGVVPLARAIRPDVVLLDIRLPDGDGIALAAEVARAVPSSTIVLTSSLPAADCRDRLARMAAPPPFLPKGELSGVALRSLLA